MTWFKKPLGEVATLQRGFDLPESKRDEGLHPVVSSGGVTGRHSMPMVSGPGVVTGRYGSLGEVYYIPNDFWPLNTTLWVKDFHGNNKKFVYHLLASLNFTKFSGKTGVPGVNRNDLHKVYVLLPPVEVQQNIAATADLWDSAIEKTERLIAAKERRFSALRERCLQKTQQTKRVKLQAVTRESTARNGARLGRDSIMAVTKRVGMRPMKEETIAAGIERYKVVRPRAFAYNPMRLNIGSIAMSPFDADVLVSPDYVVFECDESRLLPGYLNHLRFSRHWTNYFESAGNGSVRVRIYYDDLSAFTFDLPPVDVQKCVVDFLDAVGLEIDLLKKQAEAYRRQKRGLMQKLLTGAWRVRVGGGGTDEHGLSPTYTD